MTEDLELVYVGDPMCSWCWGFAPVLQALRRRYELPLRTLVGGLRPGTEEPADRELREFLAHHWEEVAERSGQPFDLDSLAPDGLVSDGWRYDTEPACRAVVAMRGLAPSSVVLDWFGRIQQAFYAEGTDVTDLDVLGALAEEFLDGHPVVDPARFEEALRDPATRERTWEDFRRTRAWGIRGYPTLLVRDGDDLAIAAPGWVPFEDLEPVITRWLTDRVGEQRAEALVSG